MDIPIIGKFLKPFKTKQVVKVPMVKQMTLLVNQNGLIN